eukprot:GHRQ01004248.1.p1 GENE.GHRQ01004248.1~~GHRQ01004248.1.p1  ORF type:complete len:263 (+),score=79.28 GHRQ01004248.1:105-893(+)
MLHASRSLQGCRQTSAQQPCRAVPVQASRRRAVHVAAHGAPSASAQKGPKMTGFVGEMRAVAMKLHTKEQAPKEGGIKAPKPVTAWAPTLKGYLQFLAESEVVYSAFESIMQEAAHPEYAKFQNTGLERTAALREDIQWMQQAHNLPAPVVEEDGPGKLYALHLQQLARDDPQFFICHYYNYFFAHTAGGRMIGTKVAQMLLDGKELKFYQYSGDVAELLDGVRASINELAEQWTREQKDHCLRETADAFQYSGKLMKCMTE